MDPRERERLRDRNQSILCEIAKFLLPGSVTLPESAGRKRTVATSVTVCLLDGYII